MDFFNKLGKKASEAYKVTADKTGKLAKEAKLRMKIGDLKNEITDVYEEIGKIIYENHVREQKQDITKDIEEKCTKIDCFSDEIEDLLKQCLELKDKKQCPNCYVQIEKEVKFCPECGTKQEQNVEEPAKDVEVVTENDEARCEDEKSNLEQTVEIESNVNLEENQTNEHVGYEQE